MTTLILINDAGNPYTVEAVKVEPLLMRILTPQPDKEIVIGRKFIGLGKTITETREQPPLIRYERAPAGLLVYTSELEEVYNGRARYRLFQIHDIISFEEYADLLTKSPNGVVDLRPLMQADQEKAKTPQPA